MGTFLLQTWSVQPYSSGFSVLRMRYLCWFSDPIADWGFQCLNFPTYDLSLWPLPNCLTVFLIPGSGFAILPAWTHFSVAPQCLHVQCQWMLKPLHVQFNFDWSFHTHVICSNCDHAYCMSSVLQLFFLFLLGSLHLPVTWLMWAKSGWALVSHACHCWWLIITSCLFLVANEVAYICEPCILHFPWSGLCKHSLHHMTIMTYLDTYISPPSDLFTTDSFTLPLPCIMIR